MAFTSGPLKGLAGADGPESKNFDPLGLAEKAPEWVPWFREAEIKHGGSPSRPFPPLVLKL